MVSKIMDTDMGLETQARCIPASISSLKARIKVKIWEYTRLILESQIAHSKFQDTQIVFKDFKPL